MAIYNLARKRSDTDQQLLNGIYYENPYYNTKNQEYLLVNGALFKNPEFNPKGNPFLIDGEFHRGSIIFRNSKFDQVRMKFDIFHQQIVINPKAEDPMLNILVSNEFISEFWIGDSHFIKCLTDEIGHTFLQVVWEEEGLKCYQAWYKMRYKSYEDGNIIRYRFSEPKQKTYLEINGVLSRYHNNRSFLNLFPADSKVQIRSYLRSGNIRVNRANGDEMMDVIQFCQRTLVQDKL